MGQKSLFLFGEAEKGEYCKPIFCSSLPQFFDYFGSPPGNSEGIAYAVQTLLNQRDLFFFRVQEEGVDLSDYFIGLNMLKEKKNRKTLSAICMPGVGEQALIETTFSLCAAWKLLLIFSEKDLYDYLTDR